MNSKFAACFIVASALLLPIVSQGADGTPSPTKVYVKDSVITTKIKAELAEVKLSSLVHIKVDTVKKGVVTLSGTTTTQAGADKAVAIASAVKGVSAVESNIKVVTE